VLPLGFWTCLLSLQINDKLQIVSFVWMNLTRGEEDSTRLVHFTYTHSQYEVRSGQPVMVNMYLSRTLGLSQR
jgi:hypothetical protein